MVTAIGIEAHTDDGRGAGRVALKLGRVAGAPRAPRSQVREPVAHRTPLPVRVRRSRRRPTEGRFWIGEGDSEGLQERREIRTRCSGGWRRDAGPAVLRCATLAVRVKSRLKGRAAHDGP